MVLAERKSSAKRRLVTTITVGGGTTVMSMAFNDGKMNNHEKVMFSSTMRNKDATFCSIFALGAFLFHRFVVNGETFPSMKDRKYWYNEPVFPSARVSKEGFISVSAMNTIFRSAIDACDVESDKVVHIGRLFNMCYSNEEGLDQTEIFKQSIHFLSYKRSPQPTGRRKRMLSW